MNDNSRAERYLVVSDKLLEGLLSILTGAEALVDCTAQLAALDKAADCAKVILAVQEKVDDLKTHVEGNRLEVSFTEDVESCSV